MKKEQTCWNIRDIGKKKKKKKIFTRKTKFMVNKTVFFEDFSWLFKKKIMCNTSHRLYYRILLMMLIKLETFCCVPLPLLLYCSSEVLEVVLLQWRGKPRHQFQILVMPMVKSAERNIQTMRLEDIVLHMMTNAYLTWSLT